MHVPDIAISVCLGRKWTRLKYHKDSCYKNAHIRRIRWYKLKIMTTKLSIAYLYMDNIDILLVWICVLKFQINFHFRGLRDVRLFEGWALIRGGRLIEALRYSTVIPFRSSRIRHLGKHVIDNWLQTGLSFLNYSHIKHCYLEFFDRKGMHLG